MIHDIDSTSSERTNPIPNSNDKIINPVSHQTVSTQYNPVGDTDTARIQQVNKTIIANDGVTNKVAFGYNPALNQWGLTVAKDGIDVMANTDLSQLVFNSNQNVFKIVSTGTATSNTYSVSGGTSGKWTNYLSGGPLIIAHNLGYVPGVIAYINYSGQYVLLPTTFQSIVGDSGTGAQLNRISVNVDATNLYILDTTLVNGVVTTPYTAGGLSIKYYLLQETAT